MELKTKARLAMGAFLTACLIPSAGMLFVPERPVAANQSLAPLPALTTADGQFNPDVLQEVTDYIADHFAFRQELITADAMLNANLFQVSAEEKVTLGKNGWLFYTETLDDCLRTDVLTDRQLWASAHTLALMQEYIQNHGARLLFTVAPNKATLYPEYLPDVGEPLDRESNLERLPALLEAEGIPYADLKEAFSGLLLYFYTDSHWNTSGASLAQRTLLNALGKEFEPFRMVEHREKNHRGDLYEMLYPTGTDLDWDTVCDREFTFTHLREPRGPDDQRIETENPSKPGSLLMFRDSFGNSLYPFMAEEFGHALFSRSMPYQLTLLEQCRADTVVIELVERNLDYLAINAPIFPAPERMLTGVPPAGQGTAQAVRSDRHPLEGFVRLEGILSQADDSSPVYVQLGEALYEASPAGENWDTGSPFTLYVPQDTPLDGGGVLCFQDGALCALPLGITEKKEG